MIGVHKSVGNNIDEKMKKFTWKIDDLEKIKAANWPVRDKFCSLEESQIPNNIPLDLTVQHWFKKNNVEKHPNGKHHFTPIGNGVPYLMAYSLGKQFKMLLDDITETDVDS